MDVLGVIDSEMTALGLDYELNEHTSPVTYPYWVGEYTDTEGINEDGLEPGDLILTGFTRGTLQELETQKELLKSTYKHGKVVKTTEGACLISFSGAFNIPQESDLKKCQVTLNIKYWKGN